MKTIVALCAVSLAVNVILAGYMVLERHDKEKAPVMGNVSAESLLARSGISQETRRLLRETGIGNLAQLRDRLRAEGLPESSVRDVVEQRLWRDGRARFDAADPAKKRPWWQKTLEPLAGDDVRMGRLQKQLQAEYRARTRELFPDEHAAMENPAMNFLPDAKRQAVQKLKEDYAAMRDRLSQEDGGVYIGNSDWEKFRYLRDEEQKDLKALLTPVEYEELTLRDVSEQSSLKKIAAVMNLTEGQFKALVKIEDWRQQEEKKAGGGNDPFAPVPLSNQALLDQIRQKEQQKLIDVLGTSGADFYQRANDPDFEAVARYVARFDEPPESIENYYALSKNVNREVTALRNNETLTPERRAELLDALALRSEASLKQLLGEPAVDSNLGLSQLINGLKKSGE